MSQSTSSYNDVETTRAAGEGVTVYTVALGPGAATGLLQRIADGTGGEAFASPDPAQLAGLYQRLVGDIIDDGTDTDGDTLTDCEERNGLFSPVNLFLPNLGIDAPLDDFAEFTFPSPDMDRSDGDGTTDGVEVRRARFADNPAFARAFQVLVDAGRTTYFVQVTGRPDRTDGDNDGLPDATAAARTENCFSFPRPGTSPFDFDSDNDELSDGVECFNGTDPLRPDIGDYGVPGLLPFTLFTPDDYDREPQPVVPVLHERIGSDVKTLIPNADPVYYDNDYNCVSNCGALERYAADKDDGNGFWGICVSGSGRCNDDASQIRDKIRDIVEQRQVFTDGARLRTEYIALSALVVCRDSYATSKLCGYNGLKDGADDVAKNLRAPDLDQGRTDTLRRRLGTRLLQLDPPRSPGSSTGWS